MEHPAMTAPVILAAALALLGAPPEPPKPPADPFRPEPGWTALDKKTNAPIWFDPKGKRVILRAHVAVREGALEHLLCGTNTKEHESVLATDAPAISIQAGLFLAGAKEGHPVRYRPKFEPPAGDAIAIELEWLDGGKPRKASAREWVKDAQTGKPLERDWVFAGSEFWRDPETKIDHYAAQGGDYITVANFSSAILDVPLDSTANDAGRVFVANTPRLPPRDTPVTMTLRPLPARPAP